MKTTLHLHQLADRRHAVVAEQDAAKLAEAQKEVTTGRLADVGASLGYKTGQTLSLRQDHARLKTIIDTNSVVSTRLSATQAALKSLSDDAQLFVGQLIGARNTDSGPTVVQNQAKAALVSFTNTINTALDGAHLFAGINADVKPLTDYYRNPDLSQPAGGGGCILRGLRHHRRRPGQRQHLGCRYAGVPGRPVQRSVRRPRLDDELVGGIRSEREEPHLDLRAHRDVHQCQST